MTAQLYKSIIKKHLPADIYKLVLMRLLQADEMEELLKESREIIEKLSSENSFYRIKIEEMDQIIGKTWN
jgi:hypothetical protein